MHVTEAGTQSIQPCKTLSVCLNKVVLFPLVTVVSILHIEHCRMQIILIDEDLVNRRGFGRAGAVDS
jgi:hypothetical protein